MKPESNHHQYAIKNYLMYIDLWGVQIEYALYPLISQ